MLDILHYCSSWGMCLWQTGPHSCSASIQNEDRSETQRCLTDQISAEMQRMVLSSTLNTHTHTPYKYNVCIQELSQRRRTGSTFLEEPKNKNKYKAVRKEGLKVKKIRSSRSAANTYRHRKTTNIWLWLCSRGTKTCLQQHLKGVAGIGQEKLISDQQSWAIKSK